MYVLPMQSLNIHMAEPTTAKLTSMHFYAWKKGLKTGMYYLRSLPKAVSVAIKRVSLTYVANNVPNTCT